jgi:uncharacterized protein (DUF58 family)
MRRVWGTVKPVLQLLTAVLLLISLFSYAMFQGNFVSWFLFYTVITMTILITAYAMIPLGNFHVERKSGQGAMQAGNGLTVEIHIERSWLFPFLYLAVEDVTEEALTKQLPYQASKIIFYPTMKRVLTYSYTIPNLKRGKYHSYGVKLSTSDIFGFVKKEKFVSMPSELLVYPKYHNIEQWEAYEKHDSETSIALQDFIEDRTSIAGAREYVPGDKLTSLDWKATARANKLMTKEFEDYVGQNFLVVFNNSVPDNSFAVSDAYEKGIELVTSIIMYAQREQLQLGFWSFGKEGKRFPFGAASEQQKNMVSYLAQTNPEEANLFTKYLKKHEDEIPGGVTLIVVSVELTDDMLDQMRTLLARRVKILFALMDKGKEVDAWEYKRLKKLRENGADAYLLADGFWAESTSKVEGG